MKKAILFVFFCYSLISLNAQMDKPDYLVFDIGKQTPPNIFSSSFSDDRSSLLLDIGMGYEYLINEKWSWISEFLLGYRHEKNIRSSLLREEDTITGIQFLRNKNMNLELSIPLYLKYKLGNGLILTGGLSSNLSLVQEYTRSNTTRSDSRSGTGTRRTSNWLEGLQIIGNLGLQVPLSDHTDLRFNLQQPAWTANFRGFGNSWYRFSNLRFTFGLNYKLGRSTE